ncbi:hypothetical protein PFISCL1PPCAC_3513, partial [Pristionchus fissidentatus]
ETLSSATDECYRHSSISERAIRSFRNLDETKFAVLTNNSFESTLLTIGVGNDVYAEKSFREAQPNTKFFAADPISQINKKLYSNLGQFFAVAVGNETKKSSASVLKNGYYRSESILHLDFYVLIKYLMKVDRIDHLWLDGEGAEYGMFPMFSRNGMFEIEKIVICQVNMEVHNPDEHQKQQFRDFMNMLINEKRYIL